MDEQAIRLRCLQLAAEIAIPIGQPRDFVLCTARLFADYAITGELPPPSDVMNADTQQIVTTGRYGDERDFAVLR